MEVKMKKAKKILSVILSAVIVLGITSCSTNSNNPDSTTTATTTTASGSGDAQFTTDKPVDIDPTQPAGTIKWLMYEDLVTNDATNVALFESKYGGTVEQEMCASGAAYFEKLGTMISSGTSLTSCVTNGCLSLTECRRICIQRSIHISIWIRICGKI